MDFEWRLRFHADTGTDARAHTDAYSGAHTDADPGSHTHSDPCTYSDAYPGSDACAHSDRQLPAVCERPYVRHGRQGHQCRQLLSMHGGWMVLDWWRL